MRDAIVRRLKRHRPSPAMLVSLIALFAALGGTSYAALKLPANSVGSAQVINGSLQTADLAKKTAAALTGKPGRQGPQGRPEPLGLPAHRVQLARAEATRRSTVWPPAGISPAPFPTR
jgi:hypothetical protein